MENSITVDCVTYHIYRFAIVNVYLLLAMSTTLRWNPTLVALVYGLSDIAL